MVPPGFPTLLRASGKRCTHNCEIKTSIVWWLLAVFYLERDWRAVGNSMMYYSALVLGLFPVVWSADPNVLHTSIQCGPTLPFSELATLASKLDGIHVVPGNPGCVAPDTATFAVQGASETELVAMLLRWELDVSYAGIQLNAMTVMAVNDAKVGVVPTRTFLSARQVSAPMGVALTAFAASGIAMIGTTLLSSRKHADVPAPSTTCYAVVLSNGFY